MCRLEIDNRKQKILMGVVALYSIGGEPVGSGVLNRHIQLSVSSATLRNEMAALTRLGLLEQPHTSAGRVPTALGYQFYLTQLLTEDLSLTSSEKQWIDSIFEELDYDPEKLAEQVASKLANMLKLTAVATTPQSDDIRIVNFEVIPVGHNTAAIMAVNSAGGVKTHVAKLSFDLDTASALKAKEVLNKSLTMLVAADVDPELFRKTLKMFGENAICFEPLVLGAIQLIKGAGKSKIFFKGRENLFRWPDLDPILRPIMEFFSKPEQLEQLTNEPGHENNIIIHFGENFEPQPLPGLCIVTKKYLAGGGLTGTLGVVGPERMNYRDVIPKVNYFSQLLGKAMSNR